MDNVYGSRNINVTLRRPRDDNNSMVHPVANAVILAPNFHQLTTVVGLLPPAPKPAAADCLQTISWTALIPTALTPQNPQKNHSGQHFWPNYLHAI